MIKTMDRNINIDNAWEFVENTGKSIFLTGKAGTGKTTFLRNVVEKSKKRIIVVAPTGVAAINARGVTIHSFFQLPFSPFVPGSQSKTKFDFSREKRKIISSLDLLIIDEISMVRADLLDAIDTVLRRFRDRYQPFGGVQLLMIGDLGQLTPVVTAEDEHIINKYYDTPYFFGSKALASIDYITIQLDKIFRQQDHSFVDILNRVREGVPTDDDLNILNSKCNPSFVPEAKSGYIRLTTHNNKADKYNETRLAAIKEKSYTYKAEISGTFPDYSYPTSLDLTLKLGAQVMFIKNDVSGDHLYYNGKIGEVTYLDNEKIGITCIDEDNEIFVEPSEWENNKYIINTETNEIETEVLGVFRQFPLKLAWAITIHKSQGLTFDKAIIDAGGSFAPGQVYVALSRCRNLQGIVLSSPITHRAIINDRNVDFFMANQQKLAQESIERLPQLKEEFRRQLMIELFDFRDLQSREDTVMRIMVEYHANSHNMITQQHKQAVMDIAGKIMAVATKWQDHIMHLNIEQLHENEFMDRIKKSANYFSANLRDILEKLINLTATVKSNNKEATKRMGTALPDLRVAYLSKKLLLDAIGTKGFSTTTFLHEKNNAIMIAIDAPSADVLKSNDAQKINTRKAKTKQKQQKPPKEKTWKITYDMYKNGMMPFDIAMERHLTMNTIMGHLAICVTEGMLDITDIIDKDKIKAIVRAVEMAGIDATKTAIKELCPPDITYNEISIVMKCI